MEEKRWDVFISHASEDKAAVALPLAEALRRAGVRVWLDDHELKVGDSLSEKVDEGLGQSRFGVVVLSPAFFAKHWPRKELAGLRALEEDGQKVILPVWHEVDKPAVRQFSVVLADVLAADTKEGIGVVAAKLLGVIFAPDSDSPSVRQPSVTRRLIEILDSTPQKSALLDFLRIHVPRTRVDLGWGGKAVLDPYPLCGFEFDAYATGVGKDPRLALASFTEIWSDPFVSGTLRISKALTEILADIKQVRDRFDGDREAQRTVRDRLVEEDDRLRQILGWFKGPPKLRLIVYAGRRSTIEVEAARHAVWRRIRGNDDDFSLRSYDNLLDRFQDVSL